jgi:dipeptidyl aminopeptidase/acylaminoacyl peptidase
MAHLIALSAGLLLVACADEAGPQFANDPMPTRPPTEAPAMATPAPLPTAAAVATPASIADLLSTRGAAPRVYLIANGAVWTVASDGEANRIFEAPLNAELVAIDPSPGAEQVAVLVRAQDGSNSDVSALILDVSGEMVAMIEGLGTAMATPAGAAVAIADRIDWSPQGDRVLVSAPGGEIVVVSPDSEDDSSTLAIEGAMVSVIRPAWSPTGESIAFIAENADGHRLLQVVAVGDGRVTDVVFPPEGRQVVEFAWMPNGISLLFTEGSAAGAPTTGTDLWRVDVDGENRQLVASAGTVAPVAKVVNAKPSPDGRSVAYAVLVPGPGGAQVDSVWVRDLGSKLGFRVALPTVASVDNLWWTNQGVVIQVRTPDAGPSRPATEALLRVNRDGSIGVLWAAPIELATPVSASPEATPATQ